MLFITCPHCGSRAEVEFHCGGEAHIERPADPSSVSDATWEEYLFIRSNPKGVHAERWVHVHGCRQWFNALRDTRSDKIIQTYPIGNLRPDRPDRREEP